MSRVVCAELMAGLPPPWPDDLGSALRAAIAASPQTVVVLDDDPTGTQTVHQVPILTRWSVEALRAELAQAPPALYVLTNTRSLPLTKAQVVNREVGHNLVLAARQAGRAFVVVSRGDSTLRGHFPGEVEALAGALGEPVDAWLLVPFFEAGGRYTINDVHYVADGPWLVPAGQTEFARDMAFGYQASNLRAWVEEKTGGRMGAQDVASVSLDDLRRGGPDRVAALLADLARGSVCIVNAAVLRDLEVFTLGLLRAEAGGKRFLYRTAASFVPIRAGIAARPLLTAADLNLPAAGGGLTVVGSYVPQTTGQLAALQSLPGVTSVEVSVPALLSDELRQNEIERAAGRANESLARGEDVVVWTSRSLVTHEEADQSLQIGERVSSGLVAIVRAVTVRPRYVLAKGGITSSDLATQALDVERATVLGQILPGVPVWELGPESRHPQIPYVVFPGNVGDPEALARVVVALKKPGR